MNVAFPQLRHRLAAFGGRNGCRHQQLPFQSCHKQVLGICLLRRPCCRSLRTRFPVGPSFTTMQVMSYRAGCTAAVSPTNKAGSGPARPKPRPQANTLDGYLRPAPQPPIELEPLLQEITTMFSVQPVSDVGSQPVSSPPVSLPPVSSPPTFNPLDNSNAVSRVRTRTARRKFLGRSERPYRQRRLLAGGCATRFASSQSASLGAAIRATRPNARNGISSRQHSKV